MSQNLNQVEKLQISEEELDQAVESTIKLAESEEGVNVNFFCTSV